MLEGGNLVSMGHWVRCWIKRSGARLERYLKDVRNAMGVYYYLVV